ncbi:MAG: GtrA family protein [Gammaproteobacteria bacterium]|nr:GtrA family protein [Gammaproteobacteria bacterium]
MNKYQTLLKQLIRFGIVGCIAAMVNMLIVILLVEQFAWHPLVANILAFLIAFQVSYFGHCYWSFSNRTVCHKHSVPRFLIVAIVSFILNEGLFYLFLTVLNLYYVLALFLVLIIVPTFTFINSKWWAFN